VRNCSVRGARATTSAISHNLANERAATNCAFGAKFFEKKQLLYMQIRIFTISIIGGEKQNEAMNTFLKAQRVLDVESQLVTLPTAAYWTFKIKYIEEGSNATTFDREKEKIDYSTLLDEASFERFSKMKETRLALAKAENIKAFMILTDVQMKNLAEIENLTIAKMKTVKGVGEKTVEKYGQQLIDCIGATPF
jgi:superfamily II DNA helicase RecQ